MQRPCAILTHTENGHQQHKESLNTLHACTLVQEFLSHARHPCSTWIHLALPNWHHHSQHNFLQLSPTEHLRRRLPQYPPNDALPTNLYQYPITLISTQHSNTVSTKNYQLLSPIFHQYDAGRPGPPWPLPTKHLCLLLQNTTADTPT